MEYTYLIIIGNDNSKISTVVYDADFTVVAIGQLLPVGFLLLFPEYSDIVK